MSKDENKSKWRGRNFLLTLNQVEKFNELKQYLSHFSSFCYAIATKEKAPTTGHEHIHTFCQYGDVVVLQGKKLCGARMDICRGSAQQNIGYIKKIDKPEERGEIIWEEGTPKYKGGMSIQEVKSMGKEDRELLPFVYYKAVEHLNAMENMTIDLNDFFKEVEVRYIYGGSGLGKTYFAKSWIESLGIQKVDVVNYHNGFWCGVTDKSNFALYDDFRDSDLPGVEFIKFIDYTIKNMNIKGSFVKNRYRYIAITSIQDPRYIYDKEWEEKKQWLRRLRVYHFYGYKQCKELTDEDLGIEVYD